VKLTAMSKSWCTMGLGLVLCLAGCQGLFPQPVYTPPKVPAPAPAPPPPQVFRPTFYVAVNSLNLRAGPGMYFFKVSVLGRNTEVEKLGDAENWSKIRVKQTGDEGWVNSRYLSATPVTAPPEVEPPAPPEVEPPAPPEPPVVKPTPPEKPAPSAPPEPEKPNKIRIM
jgi:uncharacterized protein YgiM (DUF1202 family)